MAASQLPASHITFKEEVGGVGGTYPKIGAFRANSCPPYRSTGFQPAVSPISNRQSSKTKQHLQTASRSAGRKPCYIGSWFAVLFLAAAVLCGCSKSGPSKNIASSAFDSAPADVKQLWNDALASWKNHRYPDAAKSFVSLQARNSALSKEQADELTKAMDEFGQEAFTAANKGDAGATQAVQALRGSGRRGSGR
jgi:hypothetical protein